jgi:hypothetical protein
MAVIIAENKRKAKLEEIKKEDLKVDSESQARLAEIMSDSPRVVKLNGTEWEIRSLRMGTQVLMANEICKVNKAENASFGDILKQFSINIPAVLDCLTLALLNDKNKIYTDGDKNKGFSKLYISTRETLEWDGNVEEYAPILLEVFNMIDTTFFTEALAMLQIFRANITEKRRNRKEVTEQK